MVHVADILHCAARTNLTMSERTITRVIVELTERLNSLVREFAKAVRTSAVKLLCGFPALTYVFLLEESNRMTSHAKYT